MKEKTYYKLMVVYGVIVCLFFFISLTGKNELYATSEVPIESVTKITMKNRSYYQIDSLEYKGDNVTVSYEKNLQEPVLKADYFCFSFCNIKLWNSHAEYEVTNSYNESYKKL